MNTQTATISSTLNADQINRMPTPSRNALNAVTFLPGVNTSGINRNSTINGLPESFLNITLDGVSNADNFNKSTDGFFASVTPRQDAVEAVTVTTAAGGAEDRRQRRGVDQLRHALRDQPLQRQPLRVLPDTGSSTRTTGSTSATACRGTRSS